MSKPYTLSNVRPNATGYERTILFADGSTGLVCWDKRERYHYVLLGDQSYSHVSFRKSDWDLVVELSVEDHAKYVAKRDAVEIASTELREKLSDAVKAAKSLYDLDRSFESAILADTLSASLNRWLLTELNSMSASTALSLPRDANGLVPVCNACDAPYDPSTENPAGLCPECLSVVA